MYYARYEPDDHYSTNFSKSKSQWGSETKLIYEDSQNVINYKNFRMINDWNNYIYIIAYQEGVDNNLYLWKTDLDANVKINKYYLGGKNNSIERRFPAISVNNKNSIFIVYQEEDGSQYFDWRIRILSEPNEQ